MYASTYICDNFHLHGIVTTHAVDLVLVLHFGSVTGSLGEDMLRPGLCEKQ